MANFTRVIVIIVTTDTLRKNEMLYLFMLYMLLQAVNTPTFPKQVLLSNISNFKHAYFEA